MADSTPSACAQCSCCLQLGDCPTPYSCVVPLAELKPIRRRLFSVRRPPFPASCEGWCGFIGAVLGIAAFSGLAGYVGRYLHLF